jgi:hypothetical protein
MKRAVNYEQLCGRMRGEEGNPDASSEKALSKVTNRTSEAVRFLDHSIKRDHPARGSQLL